MSNKKSVRIACPELVEGPALPTCPAVALARMRKFGEQRQAHGAQRGADRRPPAGLALAATQYWDTNGATAGCGNGGGDWTNNWSFSSAGDVATGVWTNGNDAVLSAGTDGTVEARECRVLRG